MGNIREHLSIDERIQSVEYTIDPGFVHKRKIETIIGPTGMRMIDDAIRRLPELPDWQKEVRIDHIYIQK